MSLEFLFLFIQDEFQGMMESNCQMCWLYKGLGWL